MSVRQNLMNNQSMMWSIRSALLAVIVSALLTSCTPTTPTPDPNGPLLIGDSGLPKLLVTIAYSPTPSPLAPDVQAIQTSQAPVPTAAPPTNTPTLAPYVGVFIANATVDVPSNYFVRRAPTLNATPQPTALPPSEPTQTAVPIMPPTALPPTEVPLTSAGQACAVNAAAPFATAAGNVIVRAQMGCPRAEPTVRRLVMQPFETGFMFHSDTNEIYVLSTLAIQNQAASVDTLWSMLDTWTDALPSDDPNLTPPSGLLQPTRGFGLAWRNNEAIRSSLGWATAAEQDYDAQWQDFERGWMMTGPDGRVFVLLPGTPTGLNFAPLE